MERLQTTLPLSAAAARAADFITASGLTYALPDLNQPPAADHGFAVTRTYEAVDDVRDVVHNADGSWTVKSGARVRIIVRMMAQAPRYHVAPACPPGLKSSIPRSRLPKAFSAPRRP